jgi:hypothetical protein
MACSLSLNSSSPPQSGSGQGVQHWAFSPVPEGQIVAKGLGNSHGGQHAKKWPKDWLTVTETSMLWGLHRATQVATLVHCWSATVRCECNSEFELRGACGVCCRALTPFFLLNIMMGSSPVISRKENLCAKFFSCNRWHRMPRIVCQGRPWARAGCATEQGPKNHWPQDLQNILSIYSSFELYFN